MPEPNPPSLVCRSSGRGTCEEARGPCGPVKHAQHHGKLAEQRHAWHLGTDEVLRHSANVHWTTRYFCADKIGSPLGKARRPSRRNVRRRSVIFSRSPAGVSGVPGPTRSTCPHTGPPLLAQRPFPGQRLFSLPLCKADVSRRPRSGPGRLP